MKILVRLPNWLGDMIMATGFLNVLNSFYPGAEVTVIAKKGLQGLLPLFPGIKEVIVFDKSENKGFRGAWKFGRQLKLKGKWDVFFCLPDSLSAAVMGLATGAKKRVGFKKEGRGLLLTNAYAKPKGIHRVEEYVALLSLFTGKTADNITVGLHQNKMREDYVVVNINSEASSRRLTVAKAVEIISALRMNMQQTIVLIGAPKEKAFIDSVLALLPQADNIVSRAGDTTLPQLAQLLGSAKAMLTTDSGPAHLANALQTPTIVLFGAGNEANTAPYMAQYCTVIRLGELSCEPCRKNVCVRYETPQCLERLSTTFIVEQVKAKI